MITSRIPQLRSGSGRRVLVSGLVVGICAATAVGVATPAQADDASTVTVVGTSDVYDNFLVQNVIEPGFESAYKAQTGNSIDLKYVSRGTGAALTFAKAGTASALIVHAASLENQFVADGYSAEPYGRAVFYGDYVLLGPAGDPAGVLDAAKNPTHDIATAFEKISAAGAAHKARFVSRGGTPGTTVQEHAIWALTDRTKTTLCDVASGDGGGLAPATRTGACTSADPSDPPNNPPAWYKTTNLTQGPNILNGDACNYGRGSDCYVFTDRGTFQYLRSQKAISQLQIVGRDNALAARGGAALLTNSFHAYAVNPAKFKDDPKVQINLAGATAFLNYLTSPAAQQAVGAYLAGDQDGAPFRPSAAPKINYASLPASIPSGRPVTISGTVSNPVPGTPALSGIVTELTSAPLTPANAPFTRLAVTRTNSAGGYAFRYSPDRHRRYRVSVGNSIKIENTTLSPAYGDLLAPSTVTTAPVRVVAGVDRVTAKADKARRVTVTGRLLPRATGSSAYVIVYVRKSGDGQAYRSLGIRPLRSGATSFSLRYTFKKGSFRVRVRYGNGGYTDAGYSGSLKVRVS